MPTVNDLTSLETRFLVGTVHAFKQELERRGLDESGLPSPCLEARHVSPAEKERGRVRRIMDVLPVPLHLALEAPEVAVFDAAGTLVGMARVDGANRMLRPDKVLSQV